MQCDILRIHQSQASPSKNQSHPPSHQVLTALQEFSSISDSVMSGILLPHASLRIVFSHAIPDILPNLLVIFSVPERPSGNGASEGANPEEDEARSSEDKKRQSGGSAVRSSAADAAKMDARDAALADAGREGEESGGAGGEGLTETAPEELRSVADDVRMIFDANPQFRRRGFTGPNHAAVDLANVVVALQVMKGRRLLTRPNDKDEAENGEKRESGDSEDVLNKAVVAMTREYWSIMIGKEDNANRARKRRQKNANREDGGDDASAGENEEEKLGGLEVKSRKNNLKNF